MKHLALCYLFGAACIAALSSGGSAQIPTDEEGAQMDREAAYYAPVRYAIIHNDIFELAVDQRRMSILMLPEQFTKRNLMEVLSLIKKRFPKPIDLIIEVHTTMKTIETPEEDEMARDSGDTRFRRFYGKYRRASFSRDEEREALIYTTGLRPYKEVLVRLK